MKRILAWTLITAMALFAAYAEEPATPAEAPAATATPAPTEAPAATDAPTPTKTPAPTDAPASTDASASSDTPAPTETPAPTDAPASTDTPAPTETPAPTDAPASTDTPAPTETPAPTDAPASTDVPAPPDAPASTDAPAATDAPASTDAPTSTDAPAPTETPAPGEATPGEPDEEPEFSSGYVRLTGGTKIYSDETLKNTFGTLTDGGVVYASEKSTSDDIIAFRVSFSVNGQVMTGWIRADGLTVMSEEEGQAYAASIDPSGESALPLEDVPFAPAQGRPTGGGHGWDGGGGGGAQPGQAATSSHGRGSLNDTPYWGVPLEADGAETRALTLGGEALNLTVTSEEGTFTATLSDNALTLTLTGDETALSIGGDALETLFASGIDTVSIEYPGGQLAIPTANWLSGSAYDRLRARGTTPNLLTLNIQFESPDPILTVRTETETLPVDGQTLALAEGGSTS